MKKVYALLFLIFAASFLVKLIPLYYGYKVPLGFVDTSSHISSALDLSEGNFKSIVHPWWHVRNHFVINGKEVVDRNSSSFFYPPFVHIILALAFLFMHPGLGAIIVISLLYSLSAVAAFLLCKSFKFKDGSCLIAAALISVSVPLVYSQNYGFWTFAIASIFIIISYSLLRLNFNWISVVFYILALTTHWAFFFVAVLLGFFELLYYKNKKAKFYLSAVIIATLPFYAYLFYTANPLSYIGTYFKEMILPNPILMGLGLIGLALSFRKYAIISAVTLIALFLSITYYFFKISFIFGDMVQFIYPFLIAFYTASLLQNPMHKSFRNELYALLVISILLDLGATASFFAHNKPSITNKDFDDLLYLRGQFEPSERAILSMDYNLTGWWITTMSKDSKIAYPEKGSINYKDYVLKEINNTNNYEFYAISRKNSTLVVALDASK